MSLELRVDTDPKAEKLKILQGISAVCITPEEGQWLLKLGLPQALEQYKKDRASVRKERISQLEADLARLRAEEKGNKLGPTDVCDVCLGVAGAKCHKCGNGLPAKPAKELGK